MVNTGTLFKSKETRLLATTASKTAAPQTTAAEAENPETTSSETKTLETKGSETTRKPYFCIFELFFGFWAAF